MRARVREDSRIKTVVAFGGQQYIRGEWRQVPAACEIEALTNPYLEIEPPEEKAQPEEEPEAKPKAQPKAAEPESPAPIKAARKPHK